MAKFIFSMQNLLDMKEKLEEQAKNNYSQANLEQLRLEIADSLDVRSIRRRENAIEILRTYVRQQELVVIQRQKDLEVARQRLNEAMKERKTYEKLRERAFEEFKLEENRKEQKEVDELVSYRFGVAIKEA